MVVYELPEVDGLAAVAYIYIGKLRWEKLVTAATGTCTSTLLS